MADYNYIAQQPPRSASRSQIAPSDQLPVSDSRSPLTANPQPTVSAISYVHRSNEPSGGDGFASGCYSAMMSTMGTIIGIFGSIPCCFCFPNPYRVVEQGSVGLFCRFGKYTRTVDPGLYYVNLLTESIKMVDVKIQVTDLPCQSVITKDNVTVMIDSVIYWQIVNPSVSAFRVQDVRTALIERSQTTLRHVVGAHDLQDSIMNREAVAREIQRIIAQPAQDWGVRIESVLIKDIQFTRELQENLAAAATQRRLGASRVIAAQAEVESAKLMREASDILNTPAAMQIRYLETLKTMAHESGAKVIFMPPVFPGGSSLGIGGLPSPHPISGDKSSGTTGGKKGHADADLTNLTVMDSISRF